VIRNRRIRDQRRDQPHRPLPVDVAGDGGPTLYRRWIGAVARHFGAKTVGDPGFELPRAWEFESWRSRRVTGEQAESAQGVGTALRTGPQHCTFL